MTRNEWIAKTAARLICTPFAVGCENYGNQEAIRAANNLADALEAANVAPWKDAAPQARATIAYEVEEGVHIAGHLWPKTGDAAFTRRAVAAINSACTAPALTDTAAKVVEAAEMWSQKPRTFTDIDHLEYAVRAHLAAKQGGAS